MNKKKVISIFLLITVLFIVLVGFRVKQRNDEKEALKLLKAPVTSVAVIKPKKGDISETFSTTGTIVAQSEVQVAAKVNGRLISLTVDEGSNVYAGQIIGEIDHSELDAQILQGQAQVRIAGANLALQVNGPLQGQINQSSAMVKQAEANLTQLKVNMQKAEADLNRNKLLQSQGAITLQQVEASQTQVEAFKSQMEAARQQIVSVRASLELLREGTRKEQVDSARGQTEQAGASIAILKAQLANYRILAPMNGVVTKRNLDVGSLVSPSVPVVTISKNAQPELEMNVPEKQIMSIKTGQTVEIESSSFPDDTIRVIIKEISPVVDSQTRLVKLKGIVNTNLPLKIGMMFDCKIILKEKKDTLILPAEALIFQEDKKLVYVSVNNKVEARIISIGIQTPKEVEVNSGLKPEELVIYRGNTFVKPGDKIQIQADLKSEG